MPPGPPPYLNAPSLAWPPMATATCIKWGQLQLRDQEDRLGGGGDDICGCRSYHRGYQRTGRDRDFCKSRSRRLRPLGRCVRPGHRKPGGAAHLPRRHRLKLREHDGYLHGGRLEWKSLRHAPAVCRQDRPRGCHHSVCRLCRPSKAKTSTVPVPRPASGASSTR